MNVKVIMYPAVTLDGFIADTNGECYSWISTEDESYYEAAIKQAGCAIVGRRTYEQYKDDYPTSYGTMTYVHTTRPETDQERITFVAGTPAEVLAQVAADGFSTVILSGGGDTNGMFATAGLIDEIVIAHYGVTLGSGVPLFGKYAPMLRLELLSSTQDVPGIIKSRYRVV